VNNSWLNSKKGLDIEKIKADKAKEPIAAWQ
jgi:hypothetical protein